MDKTDFIIVLVTARNFEEAEKISIALVEKKLSACCNIIKGIISIYEWEGKIEKSQESLLIIKTKKELFEKVKEDVLKNHSYDLPEIIAIPIADGLEAYLDWIGRST